MSNNNNHLTVYILLALILITSLALLSYQHATKVMITNSLDSLQLQMQRDHANLERKIVNQQIEIITNNTD